MGILIKPIVTEKMTAQGEKLNRYGFIVDRKANKLQIKAAVEQMYNVRITSRRHMSRLQVRTRSISTLTSKRRKNYGNQEVQAGNPRPA